TEESRGRAPRLFSDCVAVTAPACEIAAAGPAGLTNESGGGQVRARDRALTVPPLSPRGDDPPPALSFGLFLRSGRLLDSSRSCHPQARGARSPGKDGLRITASA